MMERSNRAETMIRCVVLIFFPKNKRDRQRIRIGVKTSGTSWLTLIETLVQKVMMKMNIKKKSLQFSFSEKYLKKMNSVNERKIPWAQMTNHNDVQRLTCLRNNPYTIGRSTGTMPLNPYKR